MIIKLSLESSHRPSKEDRLADILTATGLVKRFGDLTALDGVSFSIAEGETFGLLGPNGAGKTTSISIITGLLESDEGSVEVVGESVTNSSIKGKSHIGLVPQDLAIYPDLTATENLQFFGRLYGMGGDELEERVGEVLEVVGLTDRRDDLTKEYSGGMKRRLNASNRYYRSRCHVLQCIFKCVLKTKHITMINHCQWSFN